MLRLWIYGRVEGDYDGSPLAMPSSDRARALIGWLALHPGAHPRSELAARLWPDVPDESARASLRTAVWSVRQAWGPAAQFALDSSRNLIGLRADRTWVDAVAEVSVDVGELLPGIDDEWARTARDDYRERQLQMLAELAAEADDDARPADAVRWSRRRCTLAPLDETAHRDLLRRLESAGDHAGAVVAARQFAELLREELGVRPSPATRALQSQVRTPATHAPPPRLFGRAREIAALTDAWRAAANGSGQVVVLTGEAGIGKTSLLAELAHRVGAAGGRTAIGAGIDVGGEMPFAAWLELTKALVGTVSPVPASASWPTELARLSPELGPRLGRNEPPTIVSAPELERLRVFESVLRLVEWSCTDRPALVAIDDAHLADRASLRLTAHIGRRIGGLPLLLVLTRRDRPSRGELDALLADLGSRAIPVRELDVGPIEDRDVAALASSTLSHLDDDSLRRVVAASEGNPLLAVESTRALAVGGTAPPPNLRTAVRAALGRMPAAAHELAELLATAGRPLAAAELDGLELADLPEAVDTGIESGLLSRRDARLGFRHALLREVVYADLADASSLHGRVALALDEADHAERARHLFLAGRIAAAAAEWSAAASYARSVGALTEACDFLIRATECAPEDGHLWLELEEVLAWLSRREEMERAWEQALALLPDDERPGAWCRRGRQLRSVICHPGASFEAYRRAEALLTDDSPPDVHASTLIGLAWSQAVAGDATEVDELLESAGRWLPEMPDPVTLTDIAEIRILGLIRQGRFRDCVDIARTAGPLASQSRLPDRAYAVWVNAACALACAGDYDEALAMADAVVAATDTVPSLLIAGLAARAHLLARLGRHDEAAETVGRECACAERLDAPAVAATAAHDAGLVALAGGRYTEAAVLLGTALSDGGEISRPAAALARAEALARSGNPDAAATQLRAAVLEPIGRADQPWSLVPRMAGIQGLIAAASGDRELAAKRYDEAEQGWRRILDSVSGMTAEGYLATLVDLGRPPVVGLVEPSRELSRLGEDRAALSSTHVTR